MIKPSIKHVGVVVKPNHAEAWATACELSEWLKERDITLIGSTLSKGEICAIEEVGVDEFQEKADLIVVLGGDGTMISVARLMGRREIPVIGINYGSLGYLTEFRIEEMFSSLETILAGHYNVDGRVMIEVEHLRNDKRIGSGRVLNDLVINKSVLARIIEVEVSLDEFYVNSFRADGLIIATPTGSTAYNLSAGGPIVYPSMNALVLTPICPFTLTNRPIVIPDSSEVKLRLLNEDEGVVLTLDGQVGYQMQAGDCVMIRKSQTSFNLIQPPNRNYFDVLRNKLKWGR